MTPLYQRIRRDIEDRILSGDWPPGHRVPHEHELATRYSCSRMTANKAMASLAEAGLIVRRRRAGSVVARPHIHSAVLDIPDIPAQIEGRGQRYGLRLLTRERRRARREEKALAGDGDLLALECLHLAGDTPFALENRLINLTAVPQAEKVDFAAEAPGTWLLRHVPWTEAEHRIAAISADAKTMRLLELEPHAACLAIERRTWRGPEHITFVRQLFAGANYDLVARFTPSSQ